MNEDIIMIVSNGRRQDSTLYVLDDGIDNNATLFFWIVMIGVVIGCVMALYIWYGY